MDFEIHTIERFWRKVEKKGPTECWKWLGSVTSDGYGSFGHDYKNIRSNRMALMADGRMPADGQHALHSCDVRLCCNPAHLRWGTNGENMRERTERSVHWNRAVLESRAPMAKLNPSQVECVLRLIDAGYSQNAYAKWYQVTRVVIQRLIKNRGYKHTALAIARQYRGTAKGGA